MTAVNQNAEVRVLFYPKSAIPQRTRNGMVVNHIYSDMVKRDWADMLEAVQDFNPTISLDWQGQPAFTSISGGLVFCRFHKDGRVTWEAKPGEKTGGKEDVAGWVLRRRYAPLDCKIGTTTLDGGSFDSKWKGLQGKWETRQPHSSPSATRISNVGTALTARAQSKGDIPARRGLKFSVHPVGIIDVDGPAPRVRVTMQKKTLSVLLPHGGKPAVQIAVGNDYSTIRTLKDLPNIDLSGNADYEVEVFLLNDRYIVGINGQFFHVQLMNKPQSPKAKPSPKKADLPQGPIQINTHNCRITAGVSLIKWATPDDTPYSGSFAASSKQKTYLPPDLDLVPHVTGYSPPDALMTATATVEENAINYTVTLTSSAEGIETPIVTKCLIYKAPEWAALTPDAIDARPAVNTWDVTLAMPPIMSSSEATVSLDRVLLDSLYGDDPETGWQNYIKEDNPCQIYARWQRKDDVTGAISYDPAEIDGEPQYYRLFLGYVYYIHKQTEGFNQNTMTVNMRDPMVRLQGNNARIDYRYPPLDWLLMDAAAAASMPGENQSAPSISNLKVHGADCFKSVVQIALGDDEANLINGNGDTRRFLPVDHPPFLSAETDYGGLLALYEAVGGPPMVENGFFFPPPFNDDAEAWLKRIGEKDRCQFFYGWPDGAYVTSWPVLCYGRIPEFLKHLHPTRSSFIIIPDNNYTAGDVNKLLDSASTETRPERNVNRVLALGAEAPAGLEGVIPSIRMGEARLPPEDPRSAEQSWEKTLVLRNPLYSMPGAAEAVAMKLIADITGLLMQFPQLSLRGKPLQWGNICQVRADGTGSDATLGLDSLPFRVEQVKHSGTCGQISDWKTKVHIRPLSNSELAAIPES